MRDVSPLETRFERLSHRYQQFRSAALTAVQCWQWYSWAAFDLRPLHFERDRRVPGRRLPQRPPLRNDCHRIGFDADGRPVVFYEYSGFLDGRLYCETYRDYSSWPQTVEEAHFYANGRPAYLHECSYRDGLIRLARTVANSGSGYEEYVYTGDAVTRINVFHNNRPYVTINAAYDCAGLVRLAKVWENSMELVYERPPPGFGIEQACRVVRRELIRQIPIAVRDLGIDLPACCVVLVYQSEFPLDVMVHVGLDSEWFPANMDDQADVDLSAVADTARLLTQELALSHREELGRDLLCAVAAELNFYNWSKIMPVTEDFVVFAIDLELVDIDRNLAACVPPERLARPRAELSLTGPHM